MKFVISSSVLLTHLQAISRVIVSKNTMPILDNILFDLKGEKLTLTASDGDTTMVTDVALIESEGQSVMAVPAKTLIDSVKELPEQPLTFEMNNDTLEITIFYQNGKYNFVGFDGDEYPQKRGLSEGSSSFEAEASALLAGINRTLFATADDELRPIMNGVYFDIFPEELVFVASDSHKLVRAKNLSVQAGFKAAFVLPKKPTTLLKNLLPKESGNVKVSFDEKNACFKLESYEITCRLIEGRFPNYAAVIPASQPNKAIIDRATFIRVLRRVSVFSNPGSALVRLQLSTNNLVVSAQDIDFSTAAVESLACNYDGDPISIGFKGTFLIEILNNLSSQEVVLELADASRPGLILPIENEEHEDVLMLQMPMMLTDF